MFSSLVAAMRFVLWTRKYIDCTNNIIMVEAAYCDLVVITKLKRCLCEVFFRIGMINEIY